MYKKAGSARAREVVKEEKKHRIVRYFCIRWDTITASFPSSVLAVPAGVGSNENSPRSKITIVQITKAPGGGVGGGGGGNILVSVYKTPGVDEAQRPA